MSPGAAQTPNKSSALVYSCCSPLCSPGPLPPFLGEADCQSHPPCHFPTASLSGDNNSDSLTGVANRSSVLFAMSCQINKHPHASLSQRGDKWVPALIIKQELAGLSTQVLTGHQVFPIWNWTGWSSFPIQLSSLFPLANGRSQLFADVLTVRAHARERSFRNFYRCICHLTIVYWLSTSFISAKLHGSSW